MAHLAEGASPCEVAEPAQSRCSMREFAAALLDPDRPEPDGVAGPAGAVASKRFAVYRNNVASSLIDALEDIYPAAANIVGRDFFRAMALVFARRSPPRSRILAEYGSGFPAFIEGFEPAARMPYLADVARLERAWLDAYHAADAAPLAPQALASVAPERLLQARFTRHPATHVLRSRYAAIAIFEANRSSAGAAGRIRGDIAEDALVTRPHATVEVRRLGPGCAIFLQALMQDAPLASALEQALEDEPGFDAAGAIALVVGSGAFTAVAGY